MNFTIGKTRAAGLAPALFAATLCLAAALNAGAETVKTVNGVDIDSSVLDLYIQSRTQQPAAQAQPAQRDALLNELTDIYLLTTQEVADELRNDPQIAAQIELQSRGVLAQAIASRFFANNSISEDEIQAEYASQRELSPPLQFKARHILLATQGEAVDVVAELDGGANFEQLAKEKSTGPSGPNGGDLGWFSPDQMVAPFSRAVEALENGSYTKQPVQTQFGWHVILREESRDNTPPTLESVRDRVTQQVQQKKFQQHLATLREAATD